MKSLDFFNDFNYLQIVPIASHSSVLVAHKISTFPNAGTLLEYHIGIDLWQLKALDKSFIYGNLDFRVKEST